MNTNNPIVRKLAETLEAKTTQAVANLHNLRVEIMQAIEQAEDNARVRLHAEQITLDIDVEQALAAFTDRIHEMARDAVGRATAGLLHHVENLAGGSVNAQAASTGIPCPIPTYEEIQAEQAAEEQAAREAERTAAGTGEILTPIPAPEPITPEPIRTVAAHAVETQEVGLLPEDSEEDDPDSIDDSALLPDADEMGTTTDPDGETAPPDPRSRRRTGGRCPSRRR